MSRVEWVDARHPMLTVEHLTEFENDGASLKPGEIGLAIWTDDAVVIHGTPASVLGVVQKAVAALRAGAVPKPVRAGFVVEIAGRYVDHDNRGAMSTGMPYLADGMQRATHYSTFEGALDDLKNLPIGGAERARTVRVIEVELTPIYAVEVTVR